MNPGPAHQITVGRWCWIEGELLVYANGGRIEIGDHCYVGIGSRIWSLARVRLGSRVFVSHGVNIHDNDAHSLSAAERHRHFSELVQSGRSSFDEQVAGGEIDVGDDAWVGFNASILKGVKIGRGAVIGAGSVVTRDVPPFTVVAGNPAVPVGQSLP